MSIDPPASDREALEAAIVQSFLSENELRRFLDYKVRRRPAAIGGAGRPDQTKIYELLDAAVLEGWYYDLEQSLVADRATAPAVMRYIASRRECIGLGVREHAASQTLERVIRPDLGFEDLKKWVDGLLRVHRAVCRIDIDGNPQGTGFLVGADLVLTCHHVVEPLLPMGAKAGSGQRLNLHFDFTEGDRPSSSGLRLAANWLVASSTHHPLDKLSPTTPHGAEPGHDTLDYALLRLERSVMDDLVDGRRRAFLREDATDEAYRPDAPIFIVQHPQGRRQEVAVDTKAVIERNALQTRVRYRTNTEPGSSGSPVCDKAWRLVALHQAGTTGFSNQGIPIGTIIKNLPSEAREALDKSRAPSRVATQARLESVSEPTDQRGDDTVTPQIEKILRDRPVILRELIAQASPRWSGPETAQDIAKAVVGQSAVAVTSWLNRVDAKIFATTADRRDADGVLNIVLLALPLSAAWREIISEVRRATVRAIEIPVTRELIADFILARADDAPFRRWDGSDPVGVFPIVLTAPGAPGSG